MQNPPNDPPEDFVEVARFGRLASVRELGLVLASKSLDCCIVREGNDWLLKTSPRHLQESQKELEAYHSENRASAQAEEAAQPAPVSGDRGSLFTAAWCFLGFAVLQAEFGKGWEEAGILDAVRVFEGREWWRVITALTLHGDMPHVVANLASCLLFVGLLIPSYGQGLAWLLVVSLGGLGNAFNAWLYFPDAHRSLGASTAVFSALGLLTGDSTGKALCGAGGVGVWRWMLTLGAGVGLLAFLGSGGKEGARVDVLAHLWGFAVALPVGLVMGGLQLPAKMGGRVQRISGMLAAAGLILAWLLALRQGLW